MLEIKNITKIYKTGNFTQKALENVSINFRDCEFVSILGPSGSGKTTLLNIIGGLDKYDSGDLIINNVTTKKYKDKDWDSYRNHKIGFVFQSYNLISHQSVLKNVELALTLSGVSKKERKKRALEALKEVGLSEHVHKKPNQLSGGQMQRVAIARALVNNPDILLADEPTGALDSTTSIQIMKLLKEISKKKLVIMVTHNPELANTYSTRIVCLKDGQVTDDSNPLDSEKKEKIHAKTKKTSMSFLTALSLSLNNLMTKKARTILTAFAGSIGIIGIALILSLSTGVNNYIEKVQSDTLTSYPLSIEKTSIDTTSLMESFMDSTSSNEHDLDKVYSNNIMSNMMSSVYNQASTNNLKDFKEFLDNNEEIKKYSNDIKYVYNLNLQIYTKDYVQVNPSTIMESFGYSSTSSTLSSYGSGISLFNELTDNTDLLNSQYDLIYGSLPEEKDELVLIVDENNEIVDYVLYALGIEDSTEIQNIMQSMMTGEEVEEKENTSYTYDDLLDMEYKLVLNSDYFEYEDGVWKDISTDYNSLKDLVDDGLTLKITGIIRPKKGSNITTTYGIGYTSDLTDYVIDSINDSKIAKAQLKNKNINVFTNSKFSGLDTYESNLSKIGICDYSDPYMINIYPKNFESKEEIEKIIEDYNEDKDEEDKIEYTDYVGVLMSSVTTIVDVIGYVLIAFVSISLVVSSIMIGIITYISVLERTKEIGILRAIGASKKDISRVFNAETFIIGLFSGLIGIGLTLLLNGVINIILNSLTDVGVSATLPINGAITLIIISVLLTVIAGLFPSRVASKKDPVIALRTE